MSALLYFAYGSNMHWAQMKERCPSARFIGVAKLSDHRLVFSRQSVRRGCGVADTVSEVGRHVWGAVFEISELDLVELDTSEGYQPGRVQNSYWRRECLVYRRGDDERPIAVQAYFAELSPTRHCRTRLTRTLSFSGPGIGAYPKGTSPNWRPSR